MNLKTVIRGFNHVDIFDDKLMIGRVINGNIIICDLGKEFFHTWTDEDWRQFAAFVAPIVAEMLPFRKNQR